MSPFLPTAWQVDEAQKGTDISGAWPSSSGLYLTLYCDDPVMRTSTVPLRSPVGNLHSYLRLHLHYHMVLYIKDTSHCCNVVKKFIEWMVVWCDPIKMLIGSAGFKKSCKLLFGPPQ